MRERNVAAGDRRATSAAICLDDVAVDRDLELAERIETIAARSERPIKR
ncbi:MAG: hypothetical protein R2845_00330 [Thermomicrobiales bacterium]